MKKIIILCGAIVLAGAGCGISTNRNTKSQDTQNPQAISGEENKVEQSTKKWFEIDEKKEATARNLNIASNLSTEELAQIAQLFNDKGKDLGFKIYYPKYIPTNVKLDMNSLVLFESNIAGEKTSNTLEGESATSTKDTVVERKYAGLTYNLGGKPESKDPWIYIQQELENKQKEEYGTGVNETLLKNLYGYSTVINNSAGIFNLVVFLTKDNTLIRLTAKDVYFKTDELIKIAESMVPNN